MNISITSFRKNIFNVIETVIKNNETVLVNTKNGNVVILSEEEYKGLNETLYLTSIPGMKESIIEGMNTPIEDCVEEGEDDW